MHFEFMPTGLLHVVQAAVKSTNANAKASSPLAIEFSIPAGPNSLSRNGYEKTIQHFCISLGICQPKYMAPVELSDPKGRGIHLVRTKQNALPNYIGVLIKSIVVVKARSPATLEYKS